MGGAADPQATRGRRPLDAAVNLVPYVDILMTLMVFLVMCAIFTQISSLTVHSSQGLNDAQARLDDDRAVVSVRVTSTMIAIDSDGRHAAIARTPRLDVVALERALRDIGGAATNPPCKLSSDDGVRYADLVEVIDVAKQAGITSISIEPT